MEKRLKIIATVINDLTYDQRMIRICTSLAKAGYEVQLVGRQLPASKPIQQRPFAQQRLFCFFRKGKAFYIEYNIRLFFYLLFRPYDVVCSIDLDTILPAFWVCRWRKKVQVYDAHEYFVELPEVVRRPTVQRVWQWVAQHTIPRIRYCYTIGESMAAIFEKLYGTPFSVVRNVNYKVEKQTQIASNTGTNAPKIILYQGALNEGRGIEPLIEAMQHIEGAIVWLAGDGPLMKKLRTLVTEHGVSDKVHFLGYVFPKDLPTLTAQAYIGVNLLENRGLSYYYSLANKTFDYIQAGIPALHMDFPEYRAINTAHEVALLLPDLQVATVVAALQKLMGDDDLYQRLRANCHRAAEVYCWEREEEILLEVYEQIRKGE